MICTARLQGHRILDSLQHDVALRRNQHVFTSSSRIRLSGGGETRSFSSSGLCGRRGDRAHYCFQFVGYRHLIVSSMLTTLTVMMFVTRLLKRTVGEDNTKTEM